MKNRAESLLHLRVTSDTFINAMSVLVLAASITVVFWQLIGVGSDPDLLESLPSIEIGFNGQNTPFGIGDTRILQAQLANGQSPETVAFSWIVQHGSVDPPGPCHCSVVIYITPDFPVSETVTVFITDTTGNSRSASLTFGIDDQL